MTSKTKGKTYEIKTLTQFINIVDSENFERMLIDFGMWMAFCVDTIKTFKENHPEFSDKETHEIMEELTFIWTDDGENKITSAILKNKDTGEVIEIKQDTKK